MFFVHVASKIKKYLLIFFGLIFLVLGIIGYFLPGLPGTIWLIVAATFFVKSSDRLYKLVVNNRFFGGHVKDFLETGQMRLRTKILSLLFMWVFSLLSICLAPYSLLFDLPIFLLAVIGTIYILSRPTKPTFQ